MLLLVSITRTLANARSSSVTFSTLVTSAKPAKSPPIEKFSTSNPDTSRSLESRMLVWMAICERSVESMPMISRLMPASSCMKATLRGNSNSRAMRDRSARRFNSASPAAKAVANQALNVAHSRRFVTKF